MKLPDSVADEKALKRPIEKSVKPVKLAEQNINNAVRDMKNGRLPQERIGLLYHLAGLFGQRLYFDKMSNEYCHILFEI